MNSISEFIQKEYNIGIKPGKKGLCPFCGHLTFSIKIDDQFGKCFHPECNKYITSNQVRKSYEGFIDNTLYKIYECFKDSLLSENQTALLYLTECRRIHPKVINDSMIGAVPEKFDPSSILNKARQDIHELYSEKMKEINNLVGKKKENKYCLEEHEMNQALAQLSLVEENIERIISNNKQWICFFYVDSNLNITGIRLRKPYEKTFVYCKINRTVKGVFGLDLNTDTSEEFYQVEGEFNLLQLQSLILRVFECQGQNLEDVSYQNIIAIGSSSDPDFETIKKINLSPIIIYDSDDAGFAVVKKAQKYMHVSATCVPEPFNDIDEFILSFKDEYFKAWNEINKLILTRDFYYKYFFVVEDEIRKIRNGKEKEFILNKSVSQVIIDDMNNRGKFYSDDNSVYYFNYENKRLINIKENNKEIILFMNNYGLNPVEGIYKYVLQSIKTEAYTNGEKTTVNRSSYFDKDSFTVYIYNYENKVYKVSPEKIETVDNGCNGVLFVSNQHYEAFELLVNKDCCGLFREIIIKKINFEKSNDLSFSEMQETFEYWFYSIFFESIMVGKPIACFVGQKGSGKSFTLKKIGLLLFGKDFDVTPLANDPRDFDTTIGSSDFLALDNVDSKTDWVEDRLAVISTGGKIKFRKLYSDTEIIEIPTKCYVGVTTRTPKFNRDDVAERLLIYNVCRIEKYTPENILVKEVLDNRDEIMTDVIYQIQKIVSYMKKNPEIAYSGNFRMADYANFAMIASPALKNKKQDIFQSESDQIEKLLKKIQKTQSNLALSTEPIVDLLQKWVCESRKSAEFLTNKELCHELSNTADSMGFKFYYKNNPRGFAQKMSNIKTNLETCFNIEEKREGGRIVKYKFILKEDNDSYQTNKYGKDDYEDYDLKEPLF